MFRMTMRRNIWWKSVKMVKKIWWKSGILDEKIWWELEYLLFLY